MTVKGTRVPNSVSEIRQLIRGRLDDLGRNQEWLGAEVARLLGLEQAYRQTTVSNWMTGRSEPDSKQVFAMERVLGLRPGQLSVHYGYVPPTARPLGGGVEEAIEADPHLSTPLKRALLAAYREMRDA